MKKINKMIEAYNEKAEKWGFKKIEIVNGKINYDFEDKPINSNSFFGKIKIIYQNGYMKEDYENIKKELEKN